MPKWFARHDWNVSLNMIRSDLFGDCDGLGLVEKEIGEFSLKISSHERAMMEYLYLLDGHGNGDEPTQLMNTLAWLRPDVVQKLLEACRSAKVKRLFLVLSELADHPWMRKLDLTKVNTGKGKRQFTPGGWLSPKYQITVPRSWRLAEEVVP